MCFARTCKAAHCKLKGEPDDAQCLDEEKWVSEERASTSSGLWRLRGPTWWWWWQPGHVMAGDRQGWVCRDTSGTVGTESCQPMGCPGTVPAAWGWGHSAVTAAAGAATHAVLCLAGTGLAERGAVSPRAPCGHPAAHPREWEQRSHSLRLAGRGCARGEAEPGSSCSRKI